MSLRSLPYRPTPRARPLLVGIRVLALLSVPAVSLASAESGKGPVIDATCAWGRLSDGHGKLVRCLSQDEATRLRGGGAPAPAGSAADPSRAAPAGDTPRGVPAPAATAPAVGDRPPLTTAAASPAPLWPLPPPPKAAAPEPTPAEPAPAPVEGTLVAEVASVAADEGALPDAVKNLKKATDRLAECVEKNGGISGERAELELRFLVQARGRAEGVSVKKKRGLGDAAAKCIADVVDRRYVGYPEAPAVGATLVVTVAKKKK